jgi:hypothetical protein
MSKNDAKLVAITTKAAKAWNASKEFGKKIITFGKKTSNAAGPSGPTQQQSDSNNQRYCVTLSMPCVKTDVLQEMPKELPPPPPPPQRGLTGLDHIR